MGKRKHKRSHSRRREKRRRYSSSSSEDYENESRYPQYTRVRDSSASPSVEYEYLVDSNISNDEGCNDIPPVSSAPPQHSGQILNEETGSLLTEVLEALGDPKSSEEVFGPIIPEDISKRWGRVLVEGLCKEQKQSLIEKSLIPENFKLVKAPLLNPELTSVLNDTVRIRDKALEKSQKQLSFGISRLANLATSIIEGNTEKINLLKQVSEAGQIFLDLHYEETKRRRKLVASSLDKKFLNMISDVKRDSFLFGQNLGEKIKTSKTAERSGLQIKRNEPVASTSRRYNTQGNPRGPPRSTVQRVYRQGGQRSRYHAQWSRRAPPPPPVRDRQPRAPPAKPDKNSKAQ